MTSEPRGAVTIAEWLRGSPNPWPRIESCQDGDLHVACYYLAGAELLRTRHEKPYLKLRLVDRHGTVDGRVWDDAEAVFERVSSGGYVGVRGRVQVYQGRHQLKIEEIAPVRVEAEEQQLFLPRSSRSTEEMDRDLDRVIRSIHDRPLRSLLRRMFDPASDTGRAFRVAPAAKFNHHAYIGGLMEHTLSMAGMCDAAAKHYGDAVDRDLLIAGALLHDIGKTREISATAGFEYTTEGKLLGHIVLGIQMVADAARQVPELTPERLSLLLHLIASHQGRYEWQSPREPATLEALILHFVDDLDAKMTQARALISGVDSGWTTYDRSLGRDLYRHLTGGAGAPPPESQGFADDADEPDRLRRGESRGVPAGPAASLDLFESAVDREP